MWSKRGPDHESDRGKAMLIPIAPRTPLTQVIQELILLTINANNMNAKNMNTNDTHYTDNDTDDMAYYALA